MPSIDPVTMLLQKFPELPRYANEQLANDEPYYAYGLFASELQKRKHDSTFVFSACQFISETAKSSDPALRDILITTVIEKIAEDVELARMAKECLSKAAQELLRDVERDMFGRR